MKQSKHTPGEWHAVYSSPKDVTNNNKIDIVVYGQSNKRNGTGTLSIASVNTQQEWNYNHDEAEANAKLIASAPALLEENKQLKQQVQDYAQIINDGEVDKREQGWMQFLAPIINEYKEGSNDPLDGDEVDRLVDIIRAKINLNEGNITEEECEEILNNSK